MRMGAPLLPTSADTVWLFIYSHGDRQSSDALVGSMRVTSFATSALQAVFTLSRLNLKISFTLQPLCLMVFVPKFCWGVPPSEVEQEPNLGSLPRLDWWEPLLEEFSLWQNTMLDLIFFRQISAICWSCSVSHEGWWGQTHVLSCPTQLPGKPQTFKKKKKKQWAYETPRYQNPDLWKKHVCVGYCLWIIHSLQIVCWLVFSFT